MKFITIKYEEDSYKVNLERVNHIEITDNEVKFVFDENWVAASKKQCD